MAQNQVSPILPSLEPEEPVQNDVSQGSSDTFTISAIHLLTNEDFNEEVLKNIDVDNDVLKTLCVARVSHQIRRLLRHFGNSYGAEEIIYLANQKCLEQPCTQVRPLQSLFDSFPNTAKKGLFATRDIREGEFVIAPAPVLLTSPEECGRNRMGVIMPNIILFSGLQSDFTHYQILDVPKTRKRKRDSNSFLLRRKLRAIEVTNGGSTPVYQPSTKYYSDDEENSEKTAYDKYDICIDVNNSTDELQAIRRNCVPNCIIRYVFLHQRMEVFVTAQKDVKAGEELTLPHDYDSNLSHKVIQCAHPYRPNDICLHEKERQETILKYISMASEQTTPKAEPSTSASPN